MHLPALNSLCFSDCIQSHLDPRVGHGYEVRVNVHPFLVATPYFVAVLA